MKQPRATKEDLAEIRAGLWDSYGDISALIHRLYFSLNDARREAKRATYGTTEPH